MINPYFNPLGTDEEKSLYEDIATEYIQFAGWDIVYVPRDVFNVDDLLGRSDGEFKNGKYLEAIIEEQTGLDELNQTYSKFGMFLQYTATFTVMVKRFSEVFGDGSVPNVGDIIFLQHKTNNPKFDVVFDVRDIDNVGAVQFGGYVPMYNLRCGVWSNKGESLTSTIDSVNAHKDSYTTDSQETGYENVVIDTLLNGLKDVDVDNPFAKTF
jgi:hypothetical protein